MVSYFSNRSTVTLDLRPHLEQDVLAIRTLTSVALVEVMRAQGNHPIQVEIISEIYWQDVGASTGPIIDIALSPFETPELLVVTQGGRVVVISFSSDTIES